MAFHSELKLIGIDESRNGESTMATELQSLVAELEGNISQVVLGIISFSLPANSRSLFFYLFIQFLGHEIIGGRFAYTKDLKP